MRFLTITGLLAFALFSSLVLVSAALTFPNQLSSCQSLDKPGTYYLSQDIISRTSTNCFSITKNNITIDGQGHSITNLGSLTGSNSGIIINSFSNNTNIKNISFSGFDQAIYLFGANKTTLSGINANGNNIGLLLVSSQNTILDGITVNNNFNSGIIISNYQFLSQQSFNNYLSNINAVNNSHYGIQISGVNNNYLENINLNKNLAGLIMQSSKDNSLSDINANNNYNGIITSDLTYSHLGNIYTSNNNYAGLTLNSQTSNNLFFNIYSNNNQYGLVISNANNNRLTHLTLENNNMASIQSTYSVNTFEDLSTYNSNDYGKAEYKTKSNFISLSTEMAYLPLNAIISQNKAYVSLDASSSFIGQATITLYNLPTNFISPKIFSNYRPDLLIYDLCTDCINLTSLNAGTVVFNIASSGTFSVQETAQPAQNTTNPPSLSVQNITITNSTINSFPAKGKAIGKNK
jgi:hypothetical protein